MSSTMTRRSEMVTATHPCPRNRRHRCVGGGRGPWSRARLSRGPSGSSGAGPDRRCVFGSSTSLRFRGLGTAEIRDLLPRRLADASWATPSPGHRATDPGAPCRWSSCSTGRSESFERVRRLETRTSCGPRGRRPTARTDGDRHRRRRQRVLEPAPRGRSHGHGGQRAHTDVSRPPSRARPKEGRHDGDLHGRIRSAAVGREIPDLDRCRGRHQPGDLDELRSGRGGEQRCLRVGDGFRRRGRGHPGGIPRGTHPCGSPQAWTTPSILASSRWRGPYHGQPSSSSRRAVTPATSSTRRNRPHCSSLRVT